MDLRILEIASNTENNKILDKHTHKSKNKNPNDNVNKMLDDEYFFPIRSSMGHATTNVYKAARRRWNDFGVSNKLGRIDGRVLDDVEEPWYYYSSPDDIKLHNPNFSIPKGRGENWVNNAKNAARILKLVEDLYLAFYIFKGDKNMTGLRTRIGMELDTVPYWVETITGKLKDTNAIIDAVRTRDFKTVIRELKNPDADIFATERMEGVEEDYGLKNIEWSASKPTQEELDRRNDIKVNMLNNPIFFPHDNNITNIYKEARKRWKNAYPNVGLNDWWIYRLDTVEIMRLPEYKSTTTWLEVVTAARILDLVESIYYAFFGVYKNPRDVGLDKSAYKEMFKSQVVSSLYKLINYNSFPKKEERFGEMEVKHWFENGFEELMQQTPKEDPPPPPHDEVEGRPRTAPAVLEGMVVNGRGSLSGGRRKRRRTRRSKKKAKKSKRMRMRSRGRRSRGKR